MFDRLDFELVNALQHSPRVSWTKLAGILGTDASTLARRWARLVDEGLAWSSCYPIEFRANRPQSPDVFALVEVDCKAGHRDSVIEALSALPDVRGIETASGSRDLQLTVARSSAAALDGYTASSIASIPGVRATRTHFVRRFFKEGSQWRLDVLRQHQANALIQDRALGDDLVPATDFAFDVMESLGADVRKPAATIARELGRSLSSTASMINRLMRSRSVLTRVDFAHDIVGFEAAAFIWYEVPPVDVATVGQAISLAPQVRLCCSFIDRVNLGVMVWLRTFDELDEFELRVARAYPQAVVSDRWVIPRFAKRAGHLLDSDRRRSGYVPFPQTRVSSL